MTQQRSLAESHPFLHCVAGGVGGTVGSVLVCPLEVLKVRTQSSRYKGDNKLGMVPLLRKIIQGEGILGLYKGMAMTLVGVLPSRSIFFLNYQAFKGICRDRLSSPSSVYIVSATSASLITSTVTSPIWVVKTRVQLDEGRNMTMTVRQCMRDIWRREGLRGFYKGLQASYLGAADTALNFTIYENLKRMLIAWSRGQEPSAPFDPCRSQLQSGSDAGLAMVASFVSKLFAVSLSYPHEVLRTRMRERNSRYSGLVSTLRRIYLEEGMAGLYAGYAAHCLRVAPVTCITLATYELVVFAMEEWRWIT